MLKEVRLSKRELQRAEILAEIEKGALNCSEAAAILGISLRQLRRGRRRYEEEGIAGLAHRSRGKPSGRAFKKEKIEEVVKLLHKKYSDFGPTFATEKLLEEHGIRVSREKMRQILINEKLWIEKKARNRGYHPRRVRRSREGALVQIDGSDHDWLEGRSERMTLISFIDDATSKILLAKFVPSETTHAYMELAKTYVELYGIPLSLYSDKHSIFRINQKELRERGQLTNFGRALREIGVELICANSPQAKGRVERCFGTLQDRLVKEMRLAGVNTRDEANKFLHGYLKKHNEKFSVSALEEESAHRVVPKGLNLSKIFSFKETRQLTKDLSFQYKNTIYQVIAPKDKYRLGKQTIQIFEFLDQTLLVETEKGKVLEFKKYSETACRPQRTLDSKELLVRWPEKSPSKPKKYHPWR